MIIKSIVPLSDAEIRRIILIFEESCCPYESLKAMYPGHIRLDKDIVYFGMHSFDYTYAIYPRLKSTKDDGGVSCGE